MAHHQQVLIITRTFPGYWGRGATIDEAITNMQWGAGNATLSMYPCDEDAYVDQLGRIYGCDMNAERTVTTDSEANVINID